MTKKILIIEDQQPHLKRIKKELEKVEEFLVFPKIGKGSLEYQDDIRNLFKSERDKCFEKILNFYKDVDLFIVDITLDKNKENDTLGLDFINYLEKNSTKLTKPLKFIIISNHVKSKITNKNIDVNKHYVSKVDNHKTYPKIIRKKVVDFLNIRDEESDDIEVETKWQWFDRNITRTIMLVFFYLLILFTSFYGIWNIGKEVYHNTFFANSHINECNPSNTDSNHQTNYLMVKNDSIKNTFSSKKPHSKSKVNEQKNSNKHLKKEDTKPLKFVEHIFLYFLPLFIVLGFFSYYKTTSDIRFKNGNENDIDYYKAMASIHNTKVILLSTILSFALIKTIEKVFMSKNQSIIELSSYGVFMILLMAFIVINNKEK